MILGNWESYTLLKEGSRLLYFYILCLDFLPNSKNVRKREGFGVCDWQKMVDSERPDEL